MKEHDWRGCFSDRTPKIMKFVYETLNNVLESQFKKVHDHIMEEIEVNISPVFTPNV